MIEIKEKELIDFLTEHVTPATGYYSKQTSLTKAFKSKYPNSKLSAKKVKEYAKQQYGVFTRKVNNSKGKNMAIKDMLPIKIDGTFDYVEKKTLEQENKKDNQLTIGGYVYDIKFNKATINLWLMTSEGESLGVFLINNHNKGLCQIVRDLGTEIIGKYLSVLVRSATLKKHEVSYNVVSILSSKKDNNTTEDIRTKYYEKYHWLTNRPAHKHMKPSPLAKEVDTDLHFEATKYIKDKTDRQEASKSNSWYTLHDLASNRGMSNQELTQFINNSKLGKYYTGDHCNDYFGLIDLQIKHEGNTQIVKQAGEYLQLFSQSFKVLLIQALQEYSHYLSNNGINSHCKSNTD